MPKIENVFVLMMENRSFDHLFAFSALPGVSQPPTNFGFKSGALDQLKKDPAHEYDDVKKQVAGGQMTGFLQSAGTDAMQGFAAGSVPVLTSLAANFLLMDNWFSSMPGPTWPNRYFAHAASSGGLDNSPPVNVVGDAVYYSDHCFEFDNGHIFDRLISAGKTWRVYRGDRFPQILSLKGMVDAAGIANGDRFFRSNNVFASDLQRGDVTNYTFIEPYYDPYWNFRNGNSHHPLGSVEQGEAFISYVYNAILKSSVWESSVLLVTWDEHGGFFDHVSPPQATPPGDSPRNHDRAGPNARDCAFDRFGVRVPALLISKWLPKGLGSNIFPGQTFDHSSIVASLRSHFDLGGPLTKRDAAAPTWTDALLSRARTVVFAPTKAARVLFSAPRTVARETTSRKSVGNGSLAGFAQIAMDLDWQVAKQTGKPPLFTSSHKKQLIAAQNLFAQGTADGNEKKAHRSLIRYIAAVDARVANHERSHTKASKLISKRNRARPAA